jgi:hypothetical protein
MTCNQLAGCQDGGRPDVHPSQFFSWGSPWCPEARSAGHARLEESRRLVSGWADRRCCGQVPSCGADQEKSGYLAEGREGREPSGIGGNWRAAESWRRERSRAEQESSKATK